MSIYICAYNAARWIEKALSSAIGQTYRNLEVLVVDDGSTDDTVARVRRFSDPRVTLHQIEHMGLAKVRTYAKEHFRGVHEPLYFYRDFGAGRSGNYAARNFTMTTVLRRLWDQHGGELLLGEILEHVREPEKVLGEALRVLKPGGVLYLSMPGYADDTLEYVRVYTEDRIMDLLNRYGRVLDIQTLQWYYRQPNAHVMLALRKKKEPDHAPARGLETPAYV